MSVPSTNDALGRRIFLPNKATPKSSFNKSPIRFSNYFIKEEENEMIKKGSLEILNLDPVEEPNKPRLTTAKNSSKINFKNFYAPKAILFVSFYPFRYEHSKILKSILNFTMNNKGKLKKPLEKTLENLILEVPAPPRGIHMVEFYLYNEKITLSQPAPNNLPLTSLEMDKIFSYLKVEQIVDIFKHILLEGRIIFFSTDKNLLANTIEAFMALLHPLKYEFPSITILPLDYLSIIENYKSFVLGINLEFRESFFKDNTLEIKKNILLVDTDKKSLFYFSPTLNSENQTVSINQLSDNTLTIEDNLVNIDLPKHPRLKLCENIINYLNELKSTGHKEDRENFIKNIKFIFYDFMSKILNEYLKYIIVSNDKIEKLNEIINSTNTRELTVHDIFKSEEFLDHGINNIERQFYKCFIETKMFLCLLKKKIFPKDNKERLDIISFDEFIIEKNNKKRFTAKIPITFNTSKLFEYRDTYTVSRSKPFTKEEVAHMSGHLNMKKALQYGQEIIMDSKNNDSADFITIYHIFPKLLYDNNFFEENFEIQYVINNINFKNNLSDEIESKIQEIMSNPNLYNIYHNTGFVSNLNNIRKMENSIYLSWIHLFAISFHSCEENEKPFRFQQLVDVIKKISYLDDETCNVIFHSIIEFGDDVMMFILYELLVKKGYLRNYISFFFFVTKLNRKKVSEKESQISFLSNDTGFINFKKLISFSTRRSNLNIIPESLFNFNKLGHWGQIKFRKRTFNFGTNYTGAEEIHFETEDSCMECKQPNNVENFSTRFEQMRYDLFWVECPHCRHWIIPKLGIGLNSISCTENDDENFDIYSVNSTRYQKVIIYSPLHLKENLKMALLKEYGLKLNLENFQKKLCVLFWNSIWYFHLMGLPFDFILPYAGISYPFSVKKHSENERKPIVKLESENKILFDDSVQISPMRPLETNNSNSTKKNQFFYLEPVNSPSDFRKNSFYNENKICSKVVEFDILAHEVHDHESPQEAHEAREDEHLNLRASKAPFLTVNLEENTNACNHKFKKFNFESKKKYTHKSLDLTFDIKRIKKIKDEMIIDNSKILLSDDECKSENRKNQF